MKQYHCSTCGKPGHNKRACGKPSPSTPAQPRTPTAPPHIPYPTASRTLGKTRTVEEETEAETLWYLLKPSFLPDTYDACEQYASALDRLITITHSGENGAAIKSFVTDPHFSDWEKEEILLCAAQNRDTGAETLQALFTHRNLYPRTLQQKRVIHSVITHLIRHPRTPGRTLEQIWNLLDPQDHSVKVFANRENLPPSLMKTFVEHPDWEVRATVAYNPHLPQHLQTLLAHDKVYQVRIWLGRNTHITKETYTILRNSFIVGGDESLVREIDSVHQKFVPEQ